MIIVGCVSEKKSEHVSQMQEPVFEKLVSKELLDAGDLELVWQSIVPLKKGETIRRLDVVRDCIYALTRPKLSRFAEQGKRKNHFQQRYWTGRLSGFWPELPPERVIFRGRQ